MSGCEQPYQSMSRADRVALIISLIGALAAYLIADRILEQIPHLEDEMAYVWQAQALGRGRLTLPSPPEPKSFLVPFVVDYAGQRFGKYPPGWPAVLAIGEVLNLRAWVNPLLAGLGIWLVYQIGKKTLGEMVGLLAAGLTVTSPLFLMNAGMLLSHPLGLALATGFSLGWLEAFSTPDHPRPWLPTVSSAVCLGGLALTRPWTAVAVAFPFILHGLYLLVRGNWATRRRLIAFCVLALAISALVPAWQYAVTGDFTLNPYTLWWEYDKVGFGPGIGRAEGGHTLEKAWINTQANLRAGYYDFLGWGAFMFPFILAGLVAIRRNGRALLVASIFPSLVIFYMAYWVSIWVTGPRYFYEGLPGLMLVIAAGAAWLAGWPTRRDSSWLPLRGKKPWRSLAIAAALLILAATNLITYTPERVGELKGLYGATRARLAPFETEEAQRLAPALIIVHPKQWIEYGTLLELSNPFLDSPFIFVISRGVEADQRVASHFPERAIYHYYPDQPDQFLTQPRPPDSP